MKAFGGENMLPDLVDERHQRRRSRTNPPRHCRDVEIDAFFRVDIALPVERQMRAIFREQHFGQQLRASPAPRDRM